MGTGIWEAIKRACAAAGIRAQDVSGLVTKYILVVLATLIGVVVLAWYYDKGLLKSITNCYLNGCVVFTKEESINMINNFDYLVGEANKCRGINRSM